MHTAQAQQQHSYIFFNVLIFFYFDRIEIKKSQDQQYLVKVSLLIVDLDYIQLSLRDLNSSAFHRLTST